MWALTVWEMMQMYSNKRHNTQTTEPDTHQQYMMFCLMPSSFSSSSLLSWAFELLRGKFRGVLVLLWWEGCQAEAKPVRMDAEVWMRILTPKPQPRTKISEGSDPKFYTLMTLHLSIPTIILASWEKNHASQETLHQSLFPLSTYWAWMHLYWTMTKE